MTWAFFLICFFLVILPYADNLEIYLSFSEATDQITWIETLRLLGKARVFFQHRQTNRQREREKEEEKKKKKKSTHQSQTTVGVVSDLAKSWNAGLCCALF